MYNSEFKDIKCNFNLYRSFYAVANTGSFSEAARLLYVSQPSLSYNVKQLEEQLNTNLFYRKTNGVSLTYEGEELLKHIANAFDSIIQAEEILNESTNRKNGSIVIGAPTHIINFYLVNIIDNFLKDYPDIHIKIIEKTSSSLKEMLQKNLIDIIVDTPFLNIDNQLYEVKEISSESCCFVGDKSLMENCKTVKSLSELPLILPTVGGNLRKIIDEYFLADNIKVVPKIEAYTTETILSLVEKKLGVGFFYEKSIKKQLENNNLVKFDDKGVIPKIALTCAYLKKNQNPLLDCFLKEL